MLAIRSIILTAAISPAIMPVASAQGVPDGTTTRIPSRIIKIVEFSDRNRTYRVDLETGAVVYIDGNQPQPEPEPQPEPGPDLDGFAATVHATFVQSVKAEPAAVARLLAHAIDVTIAKAGGLGLKGQAIIDDLRATCDQLGVSKRLKGFPLGDLLQVETGGDAAKLIPALKAAKVGLEAVR